jgi:16S rRNA (uracil1498-N3)-methyltransferase
MKRCNKEGAEMHRFYAEEPGVIAGEELVHLSRVLRLEPGEQIEVLRDGRKFLARLGEITKSSAAYEEIEEMDPCEPRCRVTLYQGLCKGEKMDFIVQKCTEMGVAAIVPVVMARSIAKPGKAEQKTERYARIAREAVKQCGRARVPDVSPALPVEKALEHMRCHQRLLMPYEEGGAPMNQALPERDVALLIGPEGGIAPEEAAAVLSLGGQAVTLGSRILRTETAGLVALTLALHCAGDLS